MAAVQHASPVPRVQAKVLLFPKPEALQASFAPHAATPSFGDTRHRLVLLLLMLVVAVVLFASAAFV